MADLVFKNASLFDGRVLDIQITGNLISAMGENLSGEREIDATNLVALPGFVDLHTHLREPGYEQSETVLSGTRSAALGGYTAVHAMANTSPVADTAGVVEQIKTLGDEAGYCQVFPIGAVTVGLVGERLAELGAMAQSKAKVRVFSDDGNCVFDPLIMRRALEYVKSFDGVIAQHAQEPRLTVGAQMNEGTVSADLGLAGWPAVAEESIIARDVLIAEHVGSRIHICHLSTRGSVEIIRWAKARGIQVTAEVTPHHLVFTEEMIRSYDARYKVNPPLRTAEDVAALRAALIDGTIDIIATDHAPHPVESKDCEWAAAANGMLGLEASASVAYEVLIESGQSNWQRFAEVMSLNPAAIARDSQQGELIEVGSKANLAFFDSSKKRVISEITASKSKNNPYSGMTLSGAVKHTVFGGKLTVTNYELVEL